LSFEVRTQTRLDWSGLSAWSRRQLARIRKVSSVRQRATVDSSCHTDTSPHFGRSHTSGMGRFF